MKITVSRFLRNFGNVQPDYTTSQSQKTETFKANYICSLKVGVQNQVRRLELCSSPRSDRSQSCVPAAVHIGFKAAGA
jgi:hypothetical protein